MNNTLIDEKKLNDFASKSATPFYLYFADQIVENFNSYSTHIDGVGGLVCYSVKANSNLSILRLLAKNNSVLDVVSKGEIERVLLAGGNSKKIVFSGVGKTSDEILFGIENDILCFNVESMEELDKISQVASSRKKSANISIRVNPAIDPKTHPYITTGLSENKFGIPESEIFDAYSYAKKQDFLNIVGIDYHIGSQITDIQPFLDSANKVLGIVRDLKNMNINLSHFDIGGGLGISYEHDKIVNPSNLIEKVINILSPTNLKLIIEPGRSIVGNAGLLITRVINIKNSGQKNFAIVDAAMNDLIRPPLYDAYHNIRELNKTLVAKERTYDVVGPVCETADYLGKNRKLSIVTGDLLLIEDVGAYGFSLSSNYNSRPRVAEYMLVDNDIKLIRSRENLSNMILDEIELLI